MTSHPHHNLFHPAVSVYACVEIPWNRKASDLQVASIPAPRVVHEDTASQSTIRKYSLASDQLRSIFA